MLAILANKAANGEPMNRAATLDLGKRSASRASTQIAAAKKRKPKQRLRTFHVVILEDVKAEIRVTVKAATKQLAAQAARDAWVIDGKGELSEAVLERDVEIDGVWYDTTDEE